MNCEKCGVVIEKKEDSYEYEGKHLCENCYLELMSAPKTCDPWATFTAKFHTKESVTLTPLQEKILALLKEKGTLTEEELISALGVTSEELKNNIIPLFHMELVNLCKVEDKDCYSLR
ncbi:MAG: hypothetical protein NZ530_01920 [Thermodesulfobacteriaceae bacterium]|nr:hypothetical protein [Thermodesulfobacteriaceae bacterium]MCX8041851.1 hypothetical protein [Thermodesulfobacteriaceae bacterium]MDW8135662.1 hypothetical protein [Thermodesulfobacterium sp.]